MFLILGLLSKYRIFDGTCITIDYLFLELKMLYKSKFVLTSAILCQVSRNSNMT